MLPRTCVTCLCEKRPAMTFMERYTIYLTKLDNYRFHEGTVPCTANIEQERCFTKKTSLTVIFSSMAPKPETSSFSVRFYTHRTNTVDDNACSYGWEVFGSHCYYFGRDQKNWTGAKEFCEKSDSNLARIETPEENEWLYNHREKEDMWTGGIRSFYDDFIWYDNREDMLYTNWNFMEPSNSYDNEDCMLLLITNSGRWNDRKCSTEAEFICEKNWTLETTQCFDSWSSQTRTWSCGFRYMRCKAIYVASMKMEVSRRRKILAHRELTEDQKKYVQDLQRFLEFDSDYEELWLKTSVVEKKLSVLRNKLEPISFLSQPAKQTRFQVSEGMFTSLLISLGQACCLTSSLCLHKQTRTSWNNLRGVAVKSQPECRFFNSRTFGNCAMLKPKAIVSVVEVKNGKRFGYTGLKHQGRESFS
ncbi:CSPG3 [Mytilus edulis]|uniref:NCAN n=1 Tax=Mytilus edulis TaxID=6550 RepID=A0A8S3SDM1_MYTED|nr:CSPG3 [Mytilus edulis]